MATEERKKPNRLWRGRGAILFRDSIDEGMQGENLRVSIRSHEMGSGRETLTEKVGRQLMEGL